MKNLTLYICILISSFLFSQENPWVNSTEKNPWLIDDTSKVLSNTFSIDSISETPISDSSKLAIQNQIDFRELGKQETPGKGDFIFGFTNGVLLNIYGFVPAMIGSLVPTSKTIKRVRCLKQKYPHISREQKRKYKIGVQNKRSKKTAYGTTIGAATQWVIIFIIIAIDKAG